MDIVDFVKNACGIDLWPYQEEFLRKLQDIPRDRKIILLSNGRTYLKGDSYENRK